MRARQVVHAGGVWGDDVLIDAPTLRLEFLAIAMSYLWVYIIDGSTLRKLLRKYPETAQLLRRIQVRWIARRGIVRKAETEMSRLGHMFRGRSNNIYARDVVRALSPAERASQAQHGNRRFAKRRSTMSASVQVALMSTCHNATLRVHRVHTACVPPSAPFAQRVRPLSGAMATDWGKKARDKMDSGPDQADGAGRRASGEIEETVNSSPDLARMGAADPKLTATVNKLQDDVSRLTSSMDILLQRLPAVQPAQAPAPSGGSFGGRIRSGAEGRSDERRKSKRGGSRGSCTGFFTKPACRGTLSKQDPMSC